MKRSNFTTDIDLKGASLAYDRASPDDIERYAKRLVGHCTREYIPAEKIREYEGIKNLSVKGILGQLIEEFYFGKKPNSNQEPDFVRAGVELKTTPVKKLKKGGYSSKERLVLGIIDYFKMAEESFQESAFVKKNAKLLLIFYLHEEGKFFLDLIFKLAKLWRIDDDDLKIIMDDWLKIQKKIKYGLAHEISEGDTLYLGACTKGANSKTLRQQPFSQEEAMQRALSLKQGFMTSLFNRFYTIEKRKKLEKAEKIVKNIGEYKKGMTFEDVVTKRFEPFIGKTTDEIHKMLDLDINKNAKNYYADLARGILGVRTKKIDEFEKAGVKMKTIRLGKNGIPKEHMSFPAFKYTEIIKEEWEECTLREQLEQRFFFVVYRYNEKNELVLDKVLFWTIPMSDLEGEVKKVWDETRRQIERGKYDKFPRSKDNPVSHVRPHAQNAEDTFETPQGGREMKKCFWLNREYISDVINLE
jgi:DNA mismatch repair protein MutH